MNACNPTKKPNTKAIIWYQSLAILILGLSIYQFFSTWVGLSRTLPLLNQYRHPNPLAFYQLMSDVHEALQSRQIPYSIYARTLLGAVRQQGMIPWDDDLDILILEEDETRLGLIFRSLRKLGYQWVKTPFGYKIYKGLKLKIGSYLFTYHLICLDIFIMEVNGPIIHYNEAKTQQLWPNEFFLTKEYFPLKTYKFGHLELLGPQHAKPFLERAYGPYWLFKVSKSFHLGHRLDLPIEQNLNLSDLKPAQPMGPLKPYNRHEVIK